MTTFVVLKRLGIALSGLGGRVGCVQDQGLSVCVPRLLGFILLVGFSGALLVSVLDMVWIAICGCLGGPFRAGGEGSLWAMSKIEISVRTSLAFRGLSCW